MKKLCFVLAAVTGFYSFARGQDCSGDYYYAEYDTTQEVNNVAQPTAPTPTPTPTPTPSPVVTVPPLTVTDLSYGQEIVNGVSGQTDLWGLFGLNDDIVGVIPAAVGNNGAAILTGLDGNKVLGIGATGSISTSWNVTVTASLTPFGLGGQVGSQLTGTTSIEWKAIAASDGFVHITVTITIGTNALSFKREIDIKTLVPVEVFKPLTVDNSTNNSSNGSGGGPTYGEVGYPGFWGYGTFYFDGGPVTGTVLNGGVYPVSSGCGGDYEC